MEAGWLVGFLWLECLSLCSVTEADSGEFRCEARNSYGSVEETATLTVLGE